jgi:hypothetical protein
MVTQSEYVRATAVPFLPRQAVLTGSAYSGLDAMTPVLLMLVRHLYYPAYKKEVIPGCEVADSIAPNWCFDIILQSRDDERAVSCL